MPKGKGQLGAEAAVLFIGVSVIASFIGLVFLVDAIQLYQRSDLIVARVIENPSDHSSNTTTYRPIFAFTDADGNEVTAQVRMGGSDFYYRVNAEVEIRHIRGSSPPRIRVASAGGMWALSVIMLIIGLGNLGLGLFAWRGARKEQGENEKAKAQMAWPPWA